MSTRIEQSLPAQLERMARAREARARRPVFRDEVITLSHGSGGKAMHQLLDGLVLPALAAAAPKAMPLDGCADSAIVALPQGTTGATRLAVTTDSYVVSPLFFPGGDIGKLAVYGTINDLAVAGARPLCLSLGLVLEEGLETVVLRSLLESAAAAALSAGVPIVTGDTKVVQRGKADRMFVNTTGVGVIPPERDLSGRTAREGDVVLVSGCVGDHGVAVMLSREGLELEAEIGSDTAPLHELADALLAAAPNARVLKDPTRGGVATALNEIALQHGVAIAIEEERIPLRPAVRGACEILGLDPLHIANEGKLLAIVPADEADAALRAMHGHTVGTDAAVIGEVRTDPPGMVLVRTSFGGSRVLDMLVGDPLPRIC